MLMKKAEMVTKKFNKNENNFVNRALAKGNSPETFDSRILKVLGSKSVRVGKIQLAKRRARGYRNTSNFVKMIYFLCGKLKFNYPLYLT